MTQFGHIQTILEKYTIVAVSEDSLAVFRRMKKILDGEDGAKKIDFYQLSLLVMSFY